MAANENINDLVTKEAFQQLDKLKVDMKALSEQMAETSDQGKKAFDFLKGTKSLKDLSDGTKAAAVATEQLYVGLDGLTVRMKAAEDWKARYNGSSKDMVTISQGLATALAEEARANRDNAAAKLDNAKATAAINKEAERLEKLAEKETAAVIKQKSAYQILNGQYKEVAASAKDLGAQYFMLEEKEKELNEQLRIQTNAGLDTTQLRAQLHLLGVEMENVGVLAKDAQGHALELSNGLHTVELATGQGQRKVGQYNEAARGLRDILRDTPAFAYSTATGFLAISNNIPTLTDGIAKLIAANKVLKAQGQETIPIWKTLGKELFSTAGLISLAVAGFTIFMARMSMNKGIDAATQALEKFNEQLKSIDENTGSGAAKELATVQSLLTIAQSSKEAMDIRIRAVDQLQEKYPDYLGNLSKEAILAGDTAAAMERLNDALLAKAAMEAGIEKIGAVEKKIIDLRKAEYDLQKQITQRNSVLNDRSYDKFGGTEREGYAAGIKKALEQDGKNMKLLQKQISDAIVERDAFLRIVNQEAIKAGALALDNPKKTKTKDTTLSDIDAVYQAQKRNDAAVADLARQQYDLQASENKKIYEDETNTLDARLQAQQKYQQAVTMLAVIENTKEAAITQDKLNSLYEKERLYSAGKVKMTAAEHKVMMLDEDTYTKELVANSNALQTKLTDITATGIVTVQGIRKSDQAKSLRDQKEYYTKEKTELEDRIADIQDKYNQEATVIAQSYLKREISEKTFRENIHKLQNQYTILELDEKIAEDEKLLASQVITDEKIISEIKRHLNAMKKARTDAQAEGAGIGDHNLFGLKTEDIKNAEKIADQIISINDEITKAVDERHQREIDALDVKRKMIDDNLQAEISAINGSMQSQAKKDKAIAVAKALAAQQDKQLQAQQNAIKRQQAQDDKEAAIASIIEKTAVAIISAYTPVTPASPFIAAGVAALGAVQLAKAISVQIPAYEFGTEDHPGGPALVGEVRPETIIEPGKAPYVIDKPTVKDFPVHTKVIPRVLSQEEMIATQIGFMTPKLLAMTTPANDTGRLEQSIKETGQMTVKAIRSLPITSYNYTASGIQKTVQEGSTITVYLNKKV